MTTNYVEKSKQFSDFSEQINKTRYFNQQIDVDFRFISDIAQLNDELAFCEDELLNLYNKLTSKNVVFIKDGHQVTPTNTEDVSQLISQINEQRKERFWDCIALLNYLYKTNK